MGFKILFRMDDICPTMNIESFMRFKNLFDRYDIKPIIGVVPENKDKTLQVSDEYVNFWELVKTLEEDGWTIAMHGLYHEYCTNNSGLFKRKKKSEFAGLPYQEQLEKIKKGQQILKRRCISTKVFMAPGNTLDLNTLKALKVCGFKYLTASAAQSPFILNGITVFPCRIAKPVHLFGFETVAIHSNTTEEKLFTQFEDFIKKNRKFIINFEDACELELINTRIALVQDKVAYIIQYYLINTLWKIKRKFKR